jgi:rhombotail lipoprotein
MRFLLFSGFVVFSFSLLCGCDHLINTSSTSMPFREIMIQTNDSSDSRIKEQQAPLVLPASLAIVVIPSEHHYENIPGTTLRSAADKLKEQLLLCPKYVSSVSVIAEEDIKNKASLETLRAMYGTDMAIFLSYSQDQRSSQKGIFGFLDLMIVGIFLVPGLEVKTATVIDGKVIHIPNNAIIFRASGMDERSTHSTSYAQNGTVMEESIKSFLTATTNFGGSLIKTLSKFEHYDFSQAVPVSTLSANNATEQITSGHPNTTGSKPANDYWGKVNTYKSTGGGAFGIIPLLISLAVWSAARKRK